MKKVSKSSYYNILNIGDGGIPFNGGVLYFENGNYIFKPGEADLKEAESFIPAHLKKNFKTFLSQDEYSSYYDAIE